MAKEIEVKFLDVNHAVIRAKLKTLGAKLKTPKTLFRRINLDLHDRHLSEIGSWLRLRDEGSKVTLTHKIHSKDAGGELITKEFETEVSSFESALELLLSMGMIQKAYQENYRENWVLSLDEGEVEVALDQWPHVKPHIEIEFLSGKNPKAALKKVAKMLGLDYKKAVNDDICPVYFAEYQVENREQLYSLEGGFRFGNPIKLTRKSE